MAAYNAAEWSDLFVACAGAAAALTGLLFVAISINLARILELTGLVERALESLILLLAILVVSIIGLIPGQGHAALGIELLVAGCAITLSVVVLLRTSLPVGWRHIRRRRGWLAFRLGFAVPGTIPFVVGGASVLAASGGGLYWIVVGIIGAFLGAVASAWVLLVEIQR